MKTVKSDKSIKDFSTLIFKEEKGKIYIGGEEIKPAMLDVLKGQAKFIKTSNLFEIFNATIMNEAFDLGVSQSKNWDNVLYAKALIYWNTVFNKIIKKLSE